MYYFLNDYSEGCLPEVLEALTKTNFESTSGYGTDAYCAGAAGLIRKRFGCPDAAVHFLVGGTQANFTAISAFLRPWEAVIAAETAHICVHETGAVEARGHKICCVPEKNGKLSPDSIRKLFHEHLDGTNEHMVLPRMVYISQATELGTVYTKKELQAIRDVCRELELYLYIDGARLGPAMASGACDYSCSDLPQLCDAFYIGGTKNGLLFGEALVIVNPALQPFFRNMIKQNGGMLAKGRLLGVQFGAAMRDGLWLRAARHANDLANLLSNSIEAAGLPLWLQTETNQVFTILSKEQAACLSEDFAFEFWADYDENRCVYRFVTSWATNPEAVDALGSALEALHAN